MAVRRAAHRLGFRYRLYCRDLPGHTDLVFPKHRLVVFVHGCFWHRHEGCANCTLPKTRPDFWKHKFQGNTERDRLNYERLAGLNWRMLVIWECESEKTDVLEAKLVGALGTRPEKQYTGNPRDAGTLCGCR